MTAEGAPRSDRSIVVLLVVASLVHLLLAWRLELGQDEAYVLAVTGPLQLSFFDHPPLSFWLSTAMQALFGPEVSALGLRLPFVAIASASIWALYTLTARFYGSLAGLWAGSLYCGAPFFLASAGGWVMPDGPLVLFLLLAALNLAAILEGRDAAHWGRWVLAGVLIGLAMLSKYQAVLTLVGAFALLFAPDIGLGWRVRSPMSRPPLRLRSSRRSLSGMPRTTGRLLPFSWVAGLGRARCRRAGGWA